MKDGFPIWAVYDHPKDFPDCYVARLFDNDRATDAILVASDVELIRRHFRENGLTCIARHPDDDPVIMETWL